MSTGIVTRITRQTSDSVQALVWIVGERYAISVRRSLGAWEPVHAIDVENKTRRELPVCFALTDDIIAALNSAAYGEEGNR